MKPTLPPGQTVRKRSAARTLSRIAAWFLGIPAVLALGLYIALLIHPIPLPFLSSQIRNLVVASMPAGTELELGEMALALEGYAWPVIQFTPVVYRDTARGGKVAMDALEVGFSPIRALIGQPGATVTIVGPHIQVNQDLFGPRLAEFEVVPGSGGTPETVRVIEGSTAFPDAGFRPEGIDVTGETNETTRVRSDNDWLVYNLEAAQKGMASIIEQADLGRFSRLVIKEGTFDMNDALYGYFRTFEEITLDIAPKVDGKTVEGSFSMSFAGTVAKGIIERSVDDSGQARLKISLTNFDLTSFAPTINDRNTSAGLVGTSAVSLDVAFDAATGKIQHGNFRIDLTGTELRLNDDYYPIVSSIVAVDWAPDTGTFTMADSVLSIGAVSAHTSGVFVLGLDDLYGPIVAMSMKTTDVKVSAADLPEQAEGWDMSFQGWSAPVYGAVGIDQAIITRQGMRIESKGRLDMLRKGLGIDMTVAAEGVAVSDLKRVWPSFVAPEARDWFLKNVNSGQIDSANMKLAFPVGTLGPNGEITAIPQNGVFAEIVASGFKADATNVSPAIELTGKTRVQMHDAEVTIAADGGLIPTEAGNIGIANAALVVTADDPAAPIVEVSGDMSGDLPALLAITQQLQPETLKSTQIPVDLKALAGNLSVRLVSTITLDSAYAMKNFDYSVDGNLIDFGSTVPIQGHSFGNGQFAFRATPAGYTVGGSAQLDGMNTDLSVAGDLKQPQPAMTLNASLSLDDLSKLGFGSQDMASGKAGITVTPKADGTIDVAVDLKDAALNIKDIGLTKPAGEAGSLTATVSQKGDLTDISNITLAFGEVSAKGGLQFDAKAGLQSATFSNFALSSGDATQISLTPIQDGYQVRMRGEQFDMRPLLKRFFSLDQGVGEPQASSFTQTIALDVELTRAIGFYKTNAYNMDLDLTLKGSDLRSANMQMQVGTGSTVSVVTNPTPDGKTLTVVFNDLGSVLRMAGVYAQVQGGAGSLVLQQNTETKVSNGQVNLKNFAIVDEKNIADILESHADSRRLIARGNSLSFRSAQMDFTQRVDRIQINSALLTGDMVGGSANGFIYTDKRQYDIAGTYIPMFGINNAFAKLFGPLGGSRNEGLYGITFAVTGPLDKPNFKINPMSGLVLGAFRSLFEYRAKEQPRVEETD